MKRQKARADKVIGLLPVAGAKIFGNNSISQGFDELWYSFGISSPMPESSMCDIFLLLF